MLTNEHSLDQKVDPCSHEGYEDVLEDWSMKSCLCHTYNVTFIFGIYDVWGGFPLPSSVSTLVDSYETRAVFGWSILYSFPDLTQEH
jgi:hypothetical protein